MLKYLLLFVVLGLGALAIVIALRPADFSVTRSAAMAAPPQVVFEQVNDFRKWEAWSPWAKLDPNSTVAFEGPATGVGSVFKWSGNSEVGEGRQTIVESQPGERVGIKIEFYKPMTGTSDVLFTFKGDGAGTLVTWTMSSKNNFMGKAFSLFVDCDKMMGGYFEKGLATMKAHLENPPKA